MKLRSISMWASRIFSLCCGSLLAVTVFSGQIGVPTAAELLAQIEKKGPKQVVRELNQTPNHQAWEDVLGHIQNDANDQWLAVAKALRPGTDAGSAEDLSIVVARALPKAPRLVLAMTKDIAKDDYASHFNYFRMSWICSAPFIEPEPGVVERHLADAEAALTVLDVRDDPELESKRTACLAYIRSGQSTSK